MRAEGLRRLRASVGLVLGVGMLVLFLQPHPGVCQQTSVTGGSVSEEKALKMAEQFIESNQKGMSFLNGARAGTPKLVSGEWRVPILKDGKSMGFFHARATSMENGSVPVWFAGPGDNRTAPALGPPEDGPAIRQTDRPRTKGFVGNMTGRAGRVLTEASHGQKVRGVLPQDVGRRAFSGMNTPGATPLEGFTSTGHLRAGLRDREPSDDKPMRLFAQGEFSALEQSEEPKEAVCYMELLDHFTCLDPAEAEESKADTFQTYDYYVWKFTEWQTNVCQEDGRVCFNFYDPNGRFYTQYCANLPHGYSLYQLAVGIGICEWQGDFMTGTWSIEIKQGDRVEAKNYFTVVPYCTPTLLREYMCRDPEYPENTETSTFCTTDEQAAKWILWDSRRCKYKTWVAFDYVDPNQSHYLSIYAYILPGYSEWYTWGSIYICGYYPASTPGNWYVEVYAPTCYYHVTNRFAIIDADCPVTLEEDFMCGDPENPYDTQTTTFYPTDKFAAKYTVWNTAKCQGCYPMVFIDFWDPYDYWYWGMYTALPPGQDKYWIWAAICIDNCEPAYMLGTWYADVWLCEELMASNEFEIIEEIEGEEACCFRNGSCDDMDPIDCLLQGGTPRGPGSSCAETRCPVEPPIEIDQFDLSIGELELIMPTGASELVPVTGPATVEVYFEGAHDGDAVDDDGNTLDEVVTQMVDLNLTGLSPTLGPIQVGLHPHLPSLGGIEELSNVVTGVLDVPPFGPAGSSASSFFDLYFQIIVGGQYLYTIDPKRMRSIITNKPPGPADVYENLQDIELVDEFGRPTGYVLGATRHRPRPPVEIDQFDYSIGELELLLPDGSETISVSGPATVEVYFEGAQDGDAVDNDGDLLDDVVTQMVDLDLTGLSPTLGPVHVGLHPTLPSMGEIEERENVTTGVLDLPPFGPPNTTANSFFDLYFQIEVGGQTFFTIEPKRMRSIITYKPPGPADVYENLQDIELVDEFGRPTGIYLSATRHRPRPPVEIDQFDFSLGELELLMPDGSMELIPVSGPTTVAVYFEGSQEGDALDHDNDQLDEVQTELLDLNLTGTSSTQGPVHVGLHPTIPSFGEIEERADITTGVLDVPPFGPPGTTADSFFDIFFEIDVGGNTYYTVQPKRMSSVITHKPPGPADLYENLEHIELVDEFGRPTGIYLAATRHRPYPREACCFPDGSCADMIPTDCVLEGGIPQGLGTVCAEVDCPVEPAIEIDQFDYSIGTLELSMPDGSTEMVSVSGPATAHVYFEGTQDGDADDDDGDTKDEVVTEMVDLDLTGLSPTLGPVHVGLNPNIPSLGEIEEMSNVTTGVLDVPPFGPAGTTASSFFDLYFKIEVAGRDYYTIHPKRMRSIITHKPPGPADIYENLQDIELFDEFGRPTGIFLSATRHRPRPPVEIDQFDYSIGALELLLPGGTAELVSVSGSVTAHVYFEGSHEGDAQDDDGDNRDEVATELVDMDLTGLSPTLGPIHVGLHPAIPSLGEIEEMADLTTGVLDLPPFGPAGSTAESFFDIFFQIDVGGQTFYTGDPKRMRSRITEKPPGPTDVYENLVEIPLLDENGNKTGYYLGATRHRPRPTVEIDQFDFSLGAMELITPLGTELVPVSGPATAHVFFEGSQDGDANDDDGDNRDEVVTELVDLQLIGFSPTLGPVIVGVHPSIPSLGEIEERLNNTPGTLDLPPFASSGTADSFFDIFFEIEVGGQVLYTVVPKRMRSRISHKPPGPGDVYEHLQTIELVDANGRPTGYSLGATRHRPNPPVEIDVFEYSIGEMELIMPGGGSEIIDVSGSATAHVFFEGTQEGDANDDDGNNLDEVLTQMVDLNLSGNSSLGPVQVTLNPYLPSFGQIEETADATTGVLDLPPFAPSGTADSFFDLYFQIDVGNQTMYTNVPKRMRSIITYKPPGPADVYEHLTDIPLVDALGRPTGYYLGATRHRPNPGEIEIDIMEATTALVQLLGGPLGPIPVPFILSGSAEAHVFFEGPEGVAHDDDHDGLDEVQTELVSLNLTDGVVTLTLNPNRVSPGEIEELVNNNPDRLDLDPFHPGDAQSFFDVYFQIDIAGTVVHNLQPLRIESIIGEKPPISRYFHLIPQDGPLELYDAAGNATGVFIVKAEHYTGFVEVDKFDFSIGELELVIPGGASEVVPVNGPTTVHVFFEPGEGDADDDDGDGLDEVETELVELDLSGFSPTLGPIEVHLHPGLQSTGEIEERANNTAGTLDLPPFAPTGTADSFFDIFFEIEVGGQYFYTVRPKHMSSRITEKPPGPGDIYENLENIPLVDANGNPTGYYLGATRHRPNPEECMPSPDGQWCLEVPCPDPRDICLPRCVQYDPMTEATSITDCECRGPNDCQVSPGTEYGPPCIISDNGTGTVTLPPAGCEYLSPDEVHLIIDGLPPGTTIELDPIHKDFICSEQVNRMCSMPLAPHECETEGGSLGGHGDCFESTLELNLRGTGALAGFNRLLSIPVFCEVHTGPRNPGDAVQTFATDMFRLQGELFGDPDFCTFRITAGTDFGLPSPGQTTLIQLPNGDFAVESFFDITYQIEFQGCPGSQLKGFAGTTTATLRMETGNLLSTCSGGCPEGEVCEWSITTNTDGTVEMCCDCVPEVPEACCFDDGTCANLIPSECSARGGESMGPGTACLGDSDHNGTDDLCEKDDPCEDCGPGPHWVDQCTAGMDHMPSGALVGIDMNMDCLPDVSLVLTGPVLVRRSDPRDDSNQFPGLAPVDGHLDVIDTEIISMSLTSSGGIVLTAGAGLGQGGLLSRTLGAIVEQPSDSKLADSFFDVFFEVDLGGGNYAYNHVPMRVSSVIDCVPPNATYIHPTGCISLYTSPLSGQGREVARLVTADHDTYPIPEACCYDDGSCDDVIPAECLAEGGEPKGPGTYCLGDQNENNIDDACEPKEVVAVVECDQFCEGDRVNVTIVIDMTGATPPDDSLGSFTGTLDWNTSLLTYVGDSGILAGFTGLVNVSAGHITFNGANTAGAAGEVKVLIVTFDIAGRDSSTGVIDLDFSAMAAAGTFTDLLPYLSVTDCDYHIETCGLCGDVNDDGSCNSTDALIILSYDVGLSIPPEFLIRINAGCGDINADGLTNSTDALIILSYDVEIPVPFPMCDQVGCPCPGSQTRKTATTPGGKASAIPSNSNPATGDFISVPVQVDMTGTAERLGSYTATLSWDPGVLRYLGYSGGTTPGFEQAVVNTEGSAGGQLVVAHANVEGAADAVNLFTANFEAIGPEGSFSAIELKFTALSAAQSFNDLLSGLDVLVTRGVSIGQVPTGFSLDQNYPNPFNLKTVIRYQIPEAGQVTLTIYNVLGQKIRTLVTGHFDAGRYSAVWNGLDETGSEVTSGVYMYRLEAQDLVMTRRMLLLK